MSVMILSDAHLSLLATAHARLVCAYHAVDPETAQALVATLGAANLDAYHRRYPAEASRPSLTPRYVETAWPAALTTEDLASLVQASACYLYQLDSPGRGRPAIQDRAADVVESIQSHATRALVAATLPGAAASAHRWWAYGDVRKPWAPSLGCEGW